MSKNMKEGERPPNSSPEERDLKDGQAYHAEARQKTKSNERKATPKENRLQKVIKELFGDPDEFRQKAKDFVRETEEEGQHVSTAQKKWGEENNLKFDENISVREQMAQAELELKGALGKGKEPPGWIPDVKDSSIATRYAAVITSLPEQLRNDPNVIFRETARLALSESADMSFEERAAIRRVKFAAIVEIERVRDETSICEHGFNMTHTKLLQTLTREGMGGTPTPPLEDFDIYKDGLLPEKPEPEIPDKNDFDSDDEYNEAQDKYKQEKIDWNKWKKRHDNLIKDARIMQEKFEGVSATNYKQQRGDLTRYKNQIIEGKYPKSGKPPLYNEDEADILKDRNTERIKKIEEKEKEGVDTRQEAEEAYRRKKEIEFNTLFASAQEREQLAKNPDAGVERWIRNFYKEDKFPGAGEQGAQRRMQLYLEYLDSPQYKYEYFVERDEIDLEEFYSMNDKEIDQFIEKIPKDQIREFDNKVRETKNYVSRHTALKLAQAAIDTGIPLENITNYITNSGEAAWHTAFNANGGLNGLAYEIYDFELQIARMTSGTGLKEVDNDAMDLARQRMIDHFKENKEYYGKKYVKHWGKDLDDGKLTDSAIEHFASTAHVLATVRQKTAMARLKGLAPGGDLPDLNKYQSLDGLPLVARSPYEDQGGIDSNILPAMHVARYYFDKWSNLRPAERRIYRHVTAYAAIDVGYDEIVKKEIKAAKKKDKKAYIEERDKRLTAEWKDIDKDYRKAWRKMKYDLKSPDKEYEFLLLADYGREMFGGALEMFDHDGNIWRGQQILRYVNAFWKESDTIALGYWLRQAGDAFLAERGDHAHTVFKDGNSTLHKRIKKEVGSTPWEQEGNALSVGNVLGKIAKHLPHELGQMHYEQNNSEFIDNWWDNGQAQVLARTMMGQEPRGFSDVYGFIGRRHIMMDSEMSQKGLTTIDYSAREAGLSGEQKEIISKVLKTMGAGDGKEDGTRVSEYMNFMKSLSDCTTGENLVNAFRDDPAYRKYLKRNQWTYDARLGLIDTPDKLEDGPMVKDGASERPSFSKHVGEDGRRAPMARSYGDLDIANSLVPILQKAFTSDRENLFKVLDEIEAKESIYAGGTAAMASAEMSMLAGYARMAMIDPGPLRWLGISMLSNVSEMKKWFGDHAEALTYSDIDSLLVDAREKLLGRLHTYPHMHERVKKFENHIGLRFGKFMPESRTRLWASRGVMFFLAVSALIALESLKQADTEISRPSGSKGN